MRAADSNRRGFVWLELCFATAALLILFLLFPSVAARMSSAMNPTVWPRGFWLVLTIFCLVLLTAIRVTPALYRTWRSRRESALVQREKLEKKRLLQEQRETIERLQRARGRRIY